MKSHNEAADKMADSLYRPTLIGFYMTSVVIDILIILIINYDNYGN